MKSLLKSIFIDNWPRKCLSLVLAIVIWFVVNQSLTTSKTIPNIAVRIVNIPPGRTVEGVQSNGLLNKRITLTITGKKTILEDLNSNDFEVVIDASNQRGEWIATLSKKNLVPLNPDINFTGGISKISHKNFIVKLTKLVTEKIPIIITKPIGEPPKGYQFIDIWPYQLYITISGPESVVKKLKSRGVNLTFNLSDISKAQLDDIRGVDYNTKQDVVSYFVPNHWKQISLPLLSNTPIEINDPNAKFLRIDFLRDELIPLKSAMQINLFYPGSYGAFFNIQKMGITSQNKTVETRNGLKFFSESLYAKGVSELFTEIMRDMMQILVIMTPRSEQSKMNWTLDFVNHRSLESKYVSTLLSDVSDEEIHDLRPSLREEYLRNRFRNFMNRMQLYTQQGNPFSLQIKQEGNNVIVDQVQNEK